jgi:SpoVK/Ycf46/Vps4 family AAA+-type ATPase
MPSAKVLRQLIKSGAEGNLEAFQRVSDELIKEERAKHHHLLANDLERILYGRSSVPSGQPRSMLEKIPEDRERGLRLLDVREPVRGMEDLVLSDENSSLLEEILEEHHRVKLLKSYGLYPADRLLFCGPPGCGKTLTAEVIAAELSLPLALVRTDSVVSSYLGETAANLRKVFDFISGHPLVVLFDEFDAGP